MKKNALLLYSLFIVVFYHYARADYGIITKPQENITLFVQQNKLPVPPKSIQFNQNLQETIAKQTKLITHNIKKTPLQENISPNFVVVPNTLSVQHIPIQALERIINWTLAVLKYSQPLTADALTAITETMVTELSTDKTPLVINLIRYLHYVSLLHNMPLGQAITVYLLNQFKDINNFSRLEPANQRLFLMHAFPLADRFVELFRLLQQSSLLTNTLLHRYAFFAGQALPSLQPDTFDDINAILAQLPHRIHDKFISYLEDFLPLPVTLDQTITVAQQPISALHVDAADNVIAISNNALYAINKKRHSTSYVAKKIIQPTSKRQELLPITSVISTHNMIIFSATYQKPLQDRLLVWHTATQKLQEFTTSQKITALSTIPSNTSLIIGQEDGTISIFDYTQGTIVNSRKISSGAIRAIKRCPENTSCAFVITSENNTLIAKMIDLTHVEIVFNKPINLSIDPQKRTYALAFGSQQDHFSSRQPLHYYFYFIEDTTIKALDIITGRIFIIAENIGNQATTLALSNNRSVIAVGFLNGTVKILSPEPESDPLFTMLKSSQ